MAEKVGNVEQKVSKPVPVKPVVLTCEAALADFSKIEECIVAGKPVPKDLLAALQQVKNALGNCEVCGGQGESLALTTANGSGYRSVKLNSEHTAYMYPCKPCNKKGKLFMTVCVSCGIQFERPLIPNRDGYEACSKCWPTIVWPTLLEDKKQNENTEAAKQLPNSKEKGKKA